MEDKLLKEIHYLTDLIKQHERKIPTTSQMTKKNNTFLNRNFKSVTYNSQVHKNIMSNGVNEQSKEPIQNTHIKCPSATANVHVNPNFKTQNPTIHINPKVHIKPLIHVNPKIMHNITGVNHNLKNNANDDCNGANKTESTKSNVNSNVLQANTKRSIYVNPTLMKKLSSSSQNKLVNPKELISTEQPVCSTKKIDNSSIVLISRRKLVRVDRTTKKSLRVSSVSQCRLQSPTILRGQKPKISSSKAMKVIPSVNNVMQSISMTSNLRKSCINKSKITKYKIDRTALQISKTKESRKVNPRKRKVINNSMGFVTIGDVVYKSSKNRLIRSYLLKRKRTISTKNDKFIITTNGKKLRRLKTNKEIINLTSETNTISKTRPVLNISPKTTHKNNISNKVKQKSIQILRNKLRKNNQPCLIFQRFGYCANQKNGVCPKRHDKKQVSLCKKFLQGKCLLDNCPLSHDVGPEKMPTCKYFLDGCCTRDACPYLHVKVSSNTSVCIDFLQGYCIKGNECQQRHEYICPEFGKLGNCSKGKYCPYPHKSHFSNIEKNTKYLRKSHNVEDKVQSTSVAKDDSNISNLENKIRYYERTNNLSDDIEKKKENIMRKINIMKDTLIAAETVDSTRQIEIHEISNKSLVKTDENNLEVIIESNIKKRPIGLLPAYIPID